MPRKNTKRPIREQKRSNAKIIVIVEGITDKIYLEKILDLIDSPSRRKIVNAEGIGNVPAKIRQFKNTNDCKNVIVFIDFDNVNTVYDIHVKIQKSINFNVNNIYFVNPFLEALLIYSNNTKFQINSSKTSYAKKLSDIYKLEYIKSESNIEKIMLNYNLTNWQNLSNHILNARSSGNEYTTIDLMITRINNNK